MQTDGAIQIHNTNNVLITFFYTSSDMNIHTAAIKLSGHIFKELVSIILIVARYANCIQWHGTNTFEQWNQFRNRSTDPS